MQEGTSYIKDTIDFQDKITNVCISKDVFLVTADAVGPYSNIPYESEKDKRQQRENLAEIAEVKKHSEEKRKEFIKKVELV